MSKPKSNILVITEGKTEKVIMERLFKAFDSDEKFVYHPYGTNLYPLFNILSKERDQDNWDILLLLRSKEKDPEKQKILDLRFAEIIMIFDFDPHDPQYSDEKIAALATYFCDSSEMGKLYINYPMAESFYHMKHIPDDDFDSYTANINELQNYKARVQNDFQPDHRKFATTKSEVSIAVRQNINKAWRILNENTYLLPPSQERILQAQSKTQEIAVICTCVFYVADYNSTLVPLSL